MAGKRNGQDYGASGNFQRKPNNATEEREENSSQRKLHEYLQSLFAEKQAIDQNQNPLAAKLIEQEISRAQAEGRIPRKDQKFVDIYRDKPAKINVKVKVPVNINPTFNFVGKLLGPKGNTLKRLQEDTMCRMAVLGRGSMRDREKEEEFRSSSDGKYAHLTEELHVEIAAQAPPAEAYARIAFALAEIRKYLVPDGSDDISKEQLKEMGIYEERPPRPRGQQQGGPTRRPFNKASGAIYPSGQRGGPGLRGASGKPGLIGMFDRPRQSMEEQYSRGFDESYEPDTPFDNYSSAPSSRPSFGGGNRFGDSNYNDDYGDSSNNFSETQQWRPYKSGGPSIRSDQPRYRPSPYQRPGNKM